VQKPLQKTTCGFLRYVLCFCTMATSDPRPAEAPMHRVGYARVSSVGQNLDSQMDALQKARCGRIFSDKMTGSRMDRPGWDKLMEYVRPGDTLVVAELSRMTRSLLNLLETARVLEQRQINLVSLRENIDTSTATGRCFLSMMGGYRLRGKARGTPAPTRKPPAQEGSS
jgi:DNA invertase Pin-like site-specific DNA recombinase